MFVICLGLFILYVSDRHTSKLYYILTLHEILPFLVLESVYSLS